MARTTRAAAVALAVLAVALSPLATQLAPARASVAVAATEATPTPTTTPTATPTPEPSADPVEPGEPGGPGDPTLAPSPTPTEPATPTPDPSPTPDPTEPPAPDPDPPVITAPAGGELTAGTVIAEGSAEPGSTLQVLVEGSDEPFCIVEVGESGTWSCSIDGLPSSPSTQIRAVQQADDSTIETTVVVRVLTAPVVTGGPRGLLTNGVVRGTAYPGATVSAATAGSDCTATADATGAWTCPLEGITDGEHAVTATQSTSFSDGASSPSSAPLIVTVDATVPAAPGLSSPVGGARLPLSGARFAGTGESGATVSVFAGAQVLCDVVVAGDGSWACTAGTVTAGRYRLAVLQQDAAGNVSVQSAATMVQFQSGTLSPTPTPTATRGPDPSATSPADGSAPAAPAPDAPGPSPATPGDGSGSPTPGTESGSGDGGSSSGGGWVDATRFTGALEPVFSVTGNGLWIAAVAVAALVIVLVALPGRLLTAAVGAFGGSASGTALRHWGARVTGRNRSAVEFEQAPQVTVGPLARAALATAAAAAIVTLSGPVFGQPAYLRLAVAAFAALALVGVAGAVVPALLARRVFGIVAEVRIRPWLLVVTAVCAVVSRLAELDPALVFGLVTALGLAETAGRAARGLLAVVQSLCLLVTGALAWLLALGLGSMDGGGLVLSALTEFATVAALGSLGAAAFLIVPIGHSPGRRLLDWSPATWLLTASAAFTALGLLYVPALLQAAGSGVLLPLLVTAGGFAAVAVSTWLWSRFIRPHDPDPSAG
ncbi:Ig-like domain-containing protein [Herbiconiux moechotypicola]|uniref:Ig-like domain-containing protein n=1 Tax=Herbiconiux moechotypicola TaxID=637393 RepID=UPI00217EBE87|nr:Ig-like domain-containing protein [Herbiconiux moechotypicola]MCS5730241.1 Ig-like domain-containing protein [Herbiconiux moechotypicola]